MKNQFLAFTFFFIPFLSFSQIDTISVNSKISEVTVFYSGAQITRTASVNLAKGTYQIVLKKLPSNLNEQSIQVKNITNCQILSVKMQTSTISSKERQPIKDAQLQIEEKESKIRSLGAKLDVYAKEEKLLWDNRLLGKEDKGLSVTQLREAADFYRLRLNEISSESMKLQKEIKTERENIQEINKRINVLNAEIEKNYSEILVSINCEKVTNSTLSFSYMLASAGWIPYYDFRVEEISDPMAIVYNANIFQSTGEDWKNVKIKLSGSEPLTKTSKPELQKWILERNNAQSAKREVYNADGSAIKGRVKDFETNDPIPFANIVLEQNGKFISGTTTDIEGNYLFKPIQPGNYQLKCTYVGYNQVLIKNLWVNKNAISFNDILMKESALNLEAVVVQDYKVSGSREDGVVTYIDGVKSQEIRSIPGVKISEEYGFTTSKSKQELIETNFISNVLQRNVTNLEYVIESPYTILSDGKDYAIKIKEVKKEVDYHYLSVPKIEADPFLICNLIDWQDLNLLDAKYNIFFKGTFIGESELNTTETSDTMKLSLGRDKSLYVSRMQVKEINDKKVSGKEIKATSGFTINVKNTKSYPIHIIIEDQFPVTERKSIDITLLDAANAKVDEKTGKLSWDIILQAGEKKELKFSYSVKYPQYIGVDND
jgi:hypothetical protein